MNKRIGVMFADPQPIFRQGLRAILDRELDIDVLGDTGDGAEVAAMVKELLPSVVVMDVELPNSTGSQLMREIHKSCHHVAILVLTSHTRSFHVLGMLKGGARGYILKQSADIDLVDAIRRVDRGESVLDPAVVNTVIEGVNWRTSRPVADRGLTPREREIIELMVAGQTSREITIVLGLTPKTVDNVRSHILQKLHARDKVEAITTALENGMIRILPTPQLQRGAEQ